MRSAHEHRTRERFDLYCFPRKLLHLRKGVLVRSDVESSVDMRHIRSRFVYAAHMLSQQNVATCQIREVRRAAYITLQQPLPLFMQASDECVPETGFPLCLSDFISGRILFLDESTNCADARHDVHCCPAATTTSAIFVTCPLPAWCISVSVKEEYGQTLLNVPRYT